MLFTGKLRRNLDPFEDHEDSSLWKALTEVGVMYGLHTKIRVTIFSKIFSGLKQRRS